MRIRYCTLAGLLASTMAIGCGEDEETPVDPVLDGSAQVDGATPGPDDGMPESDAGTPDPDAGGPEHDAAPPTGDVTTANVLCGFADDGMQQLVYDHMDPRDGTTTPVDEMLAFEFTWTCDGAERTLAGNGVPNHTVVGGSFASPISAQDVSMTVTLTPAVIDEVTTVKEPGYALNGVKFDPATAGTCPDDAALVGDCDPAMGQDQWRMVALPGDTSPWNFGFGVDENQAHVQPGGVYHYHGNPNRLVELLNPDYATSMTLVGWATDGFPIYSMYGYADPADAASDIVQMDSSYQRIDDPAADRPSTDDFPLGHFEQDWTYVEGSGDLDECNGRFGVTPEFPDGIYHYYITETYPTVQRCVKGTSTGGGPGGGMGPPPGGGMGPPDGMGPPPDR